MDLAPLADDVWFNAMARLNNTEIYRLPMFSPTGEDYMVNYDVQDNGLFVKNVDGGENDKQLKAVFDKYDIYRFLQD